MRDLDSSTIRWRFIALVATIVVSGSVLMAGAPQATAPPKPKPASAAPAVDPMPPGASIYLSIVHVKPGSWEDYVALQKSDAMPFRSQSPYRVGSGPFGPCSSRGRSRAAAFAARSQTR